MNENPTLVQEAPNRLASSIPLFLIHDGGGTTFGYHLLNPLSPQREVWAIHNQNYRSDRPYPTTMESMAQDYIRLIQSIGIRGPIYLGGWSLGGLLSVVIANQISKMDSPVPFSLAGLLLIESPFHRAWHEIPPIRTLNFADLPAYVKNCLRGCDDMLREWSMPTTGNGDWLPRGVLIRSSEHLPAKPGESAELPARVDVCRDDKILGWGFIGREFIIETIDVKSNHYNIFAMDKIDEITSAINQALAILDKSRGALK